MIKKAVIPVAGIGTRFLPATIAQPKEMLTIVDRPIIQYIVEEMVESGISQIIFVTGRGKHAIENHFDYSPELEQYLTEKGKKDLLEEVKRISALAKFIYVRQNKPLGNGHAILCAKEAVGDEPFVVAWGDEIFDSKVPAALQCLRAFEKYQSTIIGVTEVEKKVVERYSIMKPADPGTKNRVFEISGLIEKPASKQAPSRFASRGRYVFTPEIFNALAETKPGKGGEIWWADGVKILLKDHPVYAASMEGRILDCGNKLGYLEANVIFGLKNKEVGGDFKKFLSKL